MTITGPFQPILKVRLTTDPSRPQAEFKIKEGVSGVGRAPSNPIYLKGEQSVSNYQAEFDFDGKTVTISDLSSLNKTQLQLKSGEKEIQCIEFQKYILQHGSKISFGSVSSQIQFIPIIDNPTVLPTTSTTSPLLQKSTPPPPTPPPTEKQQEIKPPSPTHISPTITSSPNESRPEKYIQLDLPQPNTINKQHNSNKRKLDDDEDEEEELNIKKKSKPEQQKKKLIDIDYDDHDDFEMKDTEIEELNKNIDDEDESIDGIINRSNNSVNINIKNSTSSSIPFAQPISSIHLEEEKEEEEEKSGSDFEEDIPSPLPFSTKSSQAIKSSIPKEVEEDEGDNKKEIFEEEVDKKGKEKVPPIPKKAETKRQSQKDKKEKEESISTSSIRSSRQQQTKAEESISPKSVSPIRLSSSGKVIDGDGNEIENVFIKIDHDQKILKRGNHSKQKKVEEKDEQDEDNSSLPEKDKSTVLKPKIMFSMIDEDIKKSYTKFIEVLGGKVVEDSSMATHLICNEIQRSKKIIESVILGKLLIKTQWISESKRYGYFIKEDEFFVNDKKAEKEWSFNLEKSLEYARTKHKPLFEGYRFYITGNTVPPKSVLTDIINTGGGTVISDLPIAPNPNVHTIILASEKDKRSYKNWLKLGFTNIHDGEFILLAALRQEIDLKSVSLV